MINVSHQIHAVGRTVGSRVLEAGGARPVTISQTYDARIEDVWDACTNPERIPRWFLPVSGELGPGGRYRLEGNASGRIERCEPPVSFTATWEYGGETSWIEVRLSGEADGRTRLEIEHIAPVDDQRWAECGPGAVGVGWDMALIGLTIHLVSGEPVDGQRVAEWLASPEGRQFVELSSERWGAANVAAGEDEEQAAGAAERTTAAYTTADPA
jgi:uncharacterized protein YndB with AHSA1/START domain